MRPGHQRAAIRASTAPGAEFYGTGRPELRSWRGAAVGNVAAPPGGRPLGYRRSRKKSVRATPFYGFQVPGFGCPAPSRARLVKHPGINL